MFLAIWKTTGVSEWQSQQDLCLREACRAWIKPTQRLSLIHTAGLWFEELLSLRVLISEKWSFGTVCQQSGSDLKVGGSCPVVGLQFSLLSASLLYISLFVPVLWWWPWLFCIQAGVYSCFSPVLLPGVQFGSLQTTECSCSAPLQWDFSFKNVRLIVLLFFFSPLDSHFSIALNIRWFSPTGLCL